MNAIARQTSRAGRNLRTVSSSDPNYILADVVDDDTAEKCKWNRLRKQHLCKGGPKFLNLFGLVGHSVF